MIWFLLLTLISCSSHKGELKKQQKEFYYKDVSGEFHINREVRMSTHQVVLKQEMYRPQDGSKILEKIISVSDAGEVKVNGKQVPLLRPNISHYTSWLDGKKFFSQIRFDTKSRSLVVTAQSPEEKYNGTKRYSLPKGIYFCFFSQLPECIRASGYFDQLKKNSNTKMNMTVIWDSFPFHEEQFSDIGSSPLQNAKIYFDEETNDAFRLGVEVAGQVVFYHFTKHNQFIKMFWIAQGISMLPPEEYQPDNEE